MFARKSNTYLYIILPLLLLLLAAAEVVYLNRMHNISITGATTYLTVSFGMLWILFLIADVRFVEKIPKNSLRFLSLILYSLIQATLWSFADAYCITYFDEMAQLKSAINWSEYHWFKTIIVAVITFSISSIGILLNLLKSKNDLLELKNNTESLHKEAELYKLRQQFNAHFIFNSLNAINALVKSQPNEAKKMLITLSDYLRSNIKKDDNVFSALSDELNDLHHYLSIEQFRFGSRLHIIEDIDEQCLEMRTPPFIIQPLIENAIKFGLYGTLGEVVITIFIKKITDKLQIEITNPFDPTGAMPKGTGFGLPSVERRLYLLYGQNDLIKTEISATDEPATAQFKITLFLPVQQ